MPIIPGWRLHAGVVLLNLIALGAAVWIVRTPAETMVRLELPPTASAAPTSPTSAVPTVARLTVYVTGAVTRPDVVQVDAGARADDAVRACGGLTDSADPVAVNLAAPVVDGQHLHVPEHGEAMPASVDGVQQAPSSGGGAVTLAGAGTAAGEQHPSAAAGVALDINKATAAELEALPGVGPALAARIVTWRGANGPFTTVEDMLAVSGIGEKTLAGFRDLVVVR